MGQHVFQEELPHFGSDAWVGSRGTGWHSPPGEVLNPTVRYDGLCELPGKRVYFLHFAAWGLGGDFALAEQVD